MQGNGEISYAQNFGMSLLRRPTGVLAMTYR